MEKLTSQLKLKDQKSLTSLQSSEVSEVGLELYSLCCEANRVRTTQWQERCELLRRSLERPGPLQKVVRHIRKMLAQVYGGIHAYRHTHTYRPINHDMHRSLQSRKSIYVYITSYMSDKSS